MKVINISQIRKAAEQKREQEKEQEKCLEELNKHIQSRKESIELLNQRLNTTEYGIGATRLLANILSILLDSFDIERLEHEYPKKTGSMQRCLKTQ